MCRGLCVVAFLSSHVIYRCIAAASHLTNVSQLLPPVRRFPELCLHTVILLILHLQLPPPAAV